MASLLMASRRLSTISMHLASNLRNLHTSNALKSVVIASVARTPIGSFCGGLSSMKSTQLGSVAITEAINRANITPSDVQEVIMGNVISAGTGQAPARQAAKGSKCLDSTCCTTVNKVCASGMKAVMLGAQSILLGDHDIVVAGGMESMSNIPYIMRSARSGSGYGHQVVEDLLLLDGLTDAYDDIHMGVCAEDSAEKYNIGREEQDEFALNSYSKSKASTESGLLAKEIVPVTVNLGRGRTKVIDKDEEYSNLKAEKVPTLKTVFKKEGGTVTAANASKLNDGAAALVLMSSEEAERRGIKPLARIVGFADAETKPIEFPIAPALATEKVLKKTNLKVADIDNWEVNEAFSVVALANAKILGIEMDKMNKLGGAVALGHPIGMSGARITGSLAVQMKPGELGLASICNGGGGASAIILEKL